MVAPDTLPEAVAGGLGRCDLSPCASIVRDINTPANATTNPFVIIVFFIFLN
jgi:hypothetical protein